MQMIVFLHFSLEPGGSPGIEAPGPGDLLQRVEEGVGVGSTWET